MKIRARLLLLLFLVHAVLGQQPRTTTIQGVLLRSDNGEPIDSAVVVLRKAAGQLEFLDLPVFTVETSRDGRFSLPDLAPAIYRISATHAGFLRAESGTVTVAAGAKTMDLRLFMDPAGTISGRIVDKKGEPVGLATVRALRMTFKNGLPKLGVQQIAYSNDLGEYRLFALPAGRYLVSAALPDRISELNTSNTALSLVEEGRAPEVRNQNTVVGVSTPLKEVNAPVYYPGTIEPDAASPIDLPAGRSIDGINLTVTTTPVFRIRVSATGVPREQQNLRISVHSKRPDMEGTSGLAGDGTIYLEGFSADIGVVPGSYILIAQNLTSFSGYTSVDVRDSDVSVSIALQPTIEIPVRVSIESGSAFPILRLQPDPLHTVMSPMNIPPPRVAGSDSRLTVAPGDYRITLDPTFASNQYIRSIRLGPLDILKDGLHISKAPDGPLEVVIGNKPGVLAGTVVDELGQPLYGMQVALVPNQLLDRADLYKAVLTEWNGNFSIGGIAPGEYKVFAWKTSDPFAYFDPELIKRFELNSKAITIQESSSQTIELKRAGLH